MMKKGCPGLTAYRTTSVSGILRVAMAWDDTKVSLSFYLIYKMWKNLKILVLQERVFWKQGTWTIGMFSFMLLVKKKIT